MEVIVIMFSTNPFEVKLLSSVDVHLGTGDRSELGDQQPPVAAPSLHSPQSLYHILFLILLLITTTTIVVIAIIVVFDFSKLTLLR